MDNREETRQEGVDRKDTSEGPESQCLNPLDPTREDSMEDGAIIERYKYLVTDPDYPGPEIIIEIARKLLDSFQQK
jgi:hypothetical protein